MTEDDLPAVVDIERHGQGTPWTEALFLEELHRPFSHLYVSRIGNGTEITVVGYICFWVVADEIQIHNVAVHPAYRRCGVGRSLLLHALKKGYALQGRIALLEVRADNAPAR